MNAANEALPATGLPDPHIVDLWIFEVSDAGAPDQSLLTGAERDRAARFAFERDRCRFINGRLAIRNILATCLSCTAADIVLVETPEGRPRLPDDRSLVFSYSRTRLDGATRAVLAVASEGALGADIEAITREGDLALIARQHYSAEEQATLATLSGDAWRRAFFRGWSLREALMKAAGEGLADDLAAFSFAIGPGEPPKLNRAPDRYAGKTWRLETPDLVPGAIVAIARDRPIGAVRRRAPAPEKSA